MMELAYMVHVKDLCLAGPVNLAEPRSGPGLEPLAIPSRPDLMPWALTKSQQRRSTGAKHSPLQAPQSGRGRGARSAIEPGHDPDPPQATLRMEPNSIVAASRCNCSHPPVVGSPIS